MNAPAKPVTVVVTAWNAAASIGRAVRSALAETEVGEVIVVDDASSDDTVAAVERADDLSGRLTILRQPVNKGPAAARNLAIEHSSLPYVAILDSDDYLLPGRFHRLLKLRDWDIAADNIAFVPASSASGEMTVPAKFEPMPIRIPLWAFIEGNITHVGRPRAELGFIKPVIRRDLLVRTGIRYDESLRLGEDFAFYAQLLAAGARLIRSRACGYVAVERSNSLSGMHSTQDLEALLRFDDRFASEAGLDARSRAALGRHRRQLTAKVHHRQVIDVRQSRGRMRALLAALSEPALAPQLALSVLRDKGMGRPKPPAKEVRYLFE